jgi:hypothetical protein
MYLKQTHPTEDPTVCSANARRIWLQTYFKSGWRRPIAMVSILFVSIPSRYRVWSLKFKDASNPGDYKDIIEMLVPVLQKRGLMWDDYTVLGGTYRENLHNIPGNPYLNPRHPGSMFRRNGPKTEPIVDTERVQK